MLDHALEYTALGWVVVPAIPGTKRTYVKWSQVTEPDANQVMDWWTRWPASEHRCLVWTVWPHRGRCGRRRRLQDPPATATHSHNDNGSRASSCLPRSLERQGTELGGTRLRPRQTCRHHRPGRRQRDGGPVHRATVDAQVGQAVRMGPGCVRRRCTSCTALADPGTRVQG